jgi:hypothetical protein
MTPRMIPAAANPENGLGLHYSRFSPISTGLLLSAQLLAGRKIENLAANRPSQVRRDDIANESSMNFFHRIIGKLLRVFGSLVSKFKNGDDRQLLSLPLRNFHAPELAEIARLCRDKCFDPNFNNDLDRQLSVLRMRRRPRRRSSFNIMYTVDDRSRFFVYGKETHARLGTGEPHKPYCELAGSFRFGQRIDALRHYNVSETEGDRTTIEGGFLDCHNTSHSVKGRTHLNMFSNDYFSF